MTYAERIDALVLRIDGAAHVTALLARDLLAALDDGDELNIHTYRACMRRHLGLLADLNEQRRELLGVWIDATPDTAGIWDEETAEAMGGRR